MPTLSIPYSDCAAPPTAQHSGLQTAPAPICGCGSRGTGTCRARPRGRPRCPLALCWWRAPPRLHRAINLLRQREHAEVGAAPARPLKPEHLLVASPYVRVAALEQPAHRALEEGQYLRALPIRHHRGAQHRRRDCRRDPRRVRPTLRKPRRAPGSSGIATSATSSTPPRRLPTKFHSTTTTSQSRKSVRLNRDSLSALSLKRYGSIAFECSREVEGGFISRS